MKHALLLLVLIATQAHAQIIYTDVIPDSTYSGTIDSCRLDLNNDGNMDFLILQRTWDVPCPGGGAPECASTNSRPRSWVRIDPTGTNAVAITGSFAARLPQGQPIFADLTWTAVTKYLFTQDDPICGTMGGGIFFCWSGTVDGTWAGSLPPSYLGLRFNSGGSTYYGWARLSVALGGVSFTLMDYAYDSVPGEPILAGDDGSVGITSIALRTMQVAPNPFTSTLSISLQTGTTGSVICRVLSLTGQVLVTRTTAPTSGPSAINLDLASLAPGTYLLEMQVDGERMVRKVVKE